MCVDIIEYFKKMSEETGIPCKNLTVTVHPPLKKLKKRETNEF